jgi:hypothetical protein
LDKRIHVCSNEVLLDIIANHNRAFRLTSALSKYCKIVSADDWLFPECLTRMVSLAEANQSVGIVGSYQLSGGGANWRGWRVRWDEVPYPSTVIPGRDICRSHLLGGPYVFGTPTSMLYRSALIMGTDHFYPNSTTEADTSACYKYLLDSDFGFVHQVLSYERVHKAATSTDCQRLNTYESSRLSDLVEYGPGCLTREELEKRLEENLHSYYAFLATCVLHRRDRAFFDYHKKRLGECGQPFSRLRLSRALGAKLLDLLLNPKATVEKALRNGGKHYRSVPGPELQFSGE